MGQGGAGWRGPSIGGGKAMAGQGKRGGVVTVFGFRSAAHDMMHGVAGRNYLLQNRKLGKISFNFNVTHTTATAHSSSRSRHKVAPQTEQIPTNHEQQEEITHQAARRLLYLFGQIITLIWKKYTGHLLWKTSACGLPKQSPKQ